MHKLDSLPPAGRTQYCHCNWNLITSDPWVLNAIQGYQLELESNPFQMGAPPPLQYKQQETSLIQEDVRKLIQKGAIAPVNPSPQQFVSQIFVVPKEDGTHRPVINLKALNKFVKRQHFKTEGPQLIKRISCKKRTGW